MKKIAVITLTAIMASAVAAPAAFAKGGDGWFRLQKADEKRAELRADRAKGDKPSFSDLAQKLKAAVRS